MKRLVLLVTLLITSNLALAENWQLVEDSDEGARLIADVDSLKAELYQKDDKVRGTRISSIMRIVLTESITDSFIVAIDGNDCLAKQAGPVVNVLPSGKVNTYFWSIDGNRMYDAQGQWLCAVFYKAVVEKKKLPKSNATPAKKAQPKYMM